MKVKLFGITILETEENKPIKKYNWESELGDNIAEEHYQQGGDSCVHQMPACPTCKGLYEGK
jgi:hypothetical protein